MEKMKVIYWLVKNKEPAIWMSDINGANFEEKIHQALALNRNIEWKFLFSNPKKKVKILEIYITQTMNKHRNNIWSKLCLFGSNN